jgi:nucleotide-binding universal stress UspA family protein
MKILLAVDGSEHALSAVKLLIDHASWYREKPQVDLLTVHRPVPKLPGMGAAVSKSQIESYYREEGEQALSKAARLLDRAGVAYEQRALVGDPAEVIAKHAKKAGCDLIYIGTPEHRIGSVANKVLHTSIVPVLLAK